MKRILLFYYFLTFVAFTHAQDVKISKHFFSNEYWRVAVGLNIDVALASNNGESNFIKYLNPNIPEKVNGFGNSPSFGFDVDIYSANSVLGFLTSANFNTSRVVLKDDATNIKDSISLKFVEVPVYLKFRFGKTNGHGQTWLALGAGYAFPQESVVKTFDDMGYLIYEDNSKNFVKSVPFGSVIFGYEYMFGNIDNFDEKDNFRVVFYAKLTHDFGNRLNTEYDFDDRSVISNYPNSDMQFQKISFGVAFIMKIKAFAKVIGQNLKY